MDQINSISYPRQWLMDFQIPTKNLSKYYWQVMDRTQSRDAIPSKNFVYARIFFLENQL